MWTIIGNTLMVEFHKQCKWLVVVRGIGCYLSLNPSDAQISGLGGPTQNRFAASVAASKYRRRPPLYSFFLDLT